MHFLFGISGLKMHTVARAWIAVLEEWNWSFLQKLCVTILWWLFIMEPRVGTSIDYGGLRFPLSTNVIWNIGYILKSFSLSVIVGFGLRALNPIYFSDLHLVCLIVILLWNSTFHLYSKRARLSWIHTEQFENQVSVSVQKWLTYFEI